MSILQSIVLGIIQGIAEFFPISSSGHLVVIPFFFGWDYPPLYFTVTVHFATLLAVLTVFYRDIYRIIKAVILGIFKKKWRRTYDFKTGCWTGDDSFDDGDGYGHYIDDNYEIWFDAHMSDNDGDGIPYWTENNILGTDPFVDDSNLDPDNDGIPTVWEWKWGYDPLAYDNHSTLDSD